MEEAWDKGYGETIKYKHMFGKANAPYRYKAPEGFNLGMWQSNQKKAYDNGKLNNERIEKLEKIGFLLKQS